MEPLRERTHAGKQHLDVLVVGKFVNAVMFHSRSMVIEVNSLGPSAKQRASTISKGLQFVVATLVAARDTTKNPEQPLPV